MCVKEQHKHHHMSCSHTEFRPYCVQAMTSVEPAAVPKYFKEGRSMWRSNFLAATDNTRYMLAAFLSDMSNLICVPAIIAYVAPVSVALSGWGCTDV